MKRSISLPTEQDHFLQQQVESLRSEIQKGFDSIERGEGQGGVDAFVEIEASIAAAIKSKTDSLSKLSLD